MRKILKNSTDNITIINDCNDKLPFVISIPHSGLYITKEMNNKLNEDIILSNSDWYLKELYSFLEEFGFTIVINNVNRYTIDPNRELVLKKRKKYSSSFVYTKNTFSNDIYKTNPVEDEINDRIEKYYKTYHNELKKQIDSKLKVFDKVILIDLHSFGKNIGADIVLGDDNHNTMSEELFDIIKKCFISGDFVVNDNVPYKGGYITRKYGSCNSKCESIQIELSYRKYIDDREFDEEELPKINEVIMNDCKRKLKEVFISIINSYNSF